MSNSEIINTSMSPVIMETASTTSDDGQSIRPHSDQGSGYSLGHLWSCTLDPLDAMLLYICLAAVLVICLVHFSRYLFRNPLDRCGAAISSVHPGTSLLTSAAKCVTGSQKSRGKCLGESCDWTNACVSWLYLHQDRVPVLVHDWIQGLNEYARYNPANDVIIKFENAQAGSLPPVFNDVRVTTCDNESLTVNVAVECTDVVLLVSACRTNRGYKTAPGAHAHRSANHHSDVDPSAGVEQMTTVSNWDVTIEKLQGQLEISATSGIDNEINLIGHLIQGGINSVKLQTRIRARSQNPCCQQNLVKDMVDKCLLHSVTRHLLLGKHMATSGYSSPSYAQANSAQQQLTNLIYNPSTYQHGQSYQKATISPKKPERKCDFNNSLIVKVIKANGLADKEFAQADAFCVLTIDHPYQQHRTSVANNTINPFWDEHFLFELSIDSAHLEFMVYDMDTTEHRGKHYSGMDLEGRGLEGRGLEGRGLEGRSLEEQGLEGEATLLGRANVQVSAVSSKKSSCRQIIPLTSVNRHSQSTTAGSITVELIYREETASQLPTDMSMNMTRNSERSSRVQQQVQRPNFSPDHHNNTNSQIPCEVLSRSQQKLNAHEASILPHTSRNMSPPKVTLAKPSKFSDDDVFICEATTNNSTSLPAAPADYVRTPKSTNEDTPKITIEPADKHTIVAGRSKQTDANNEIMSINSSDGKERRKSRSFSEAVKNTFRSRSTERKREKTNSLRSTASSQGNTVYLTPPTHSATPSPTPSKKRSRSLSSSIRRMFSSNKPKIERRGSGHIVIPVRETSLPRDAASYSSSPMEQRAYDEDIQRQRRHLQMSAGTSAASEVIMSTSAPQHKQLLY